MAFLLQANFPLTNRIIAICAYREVISQSLLTTQNPSNSSETHEFLQPPAPPKANGKPLIQKSLSSDLEMIIETDDFIDDATRTTLGDDSNHHEEHEHETIE